MIHDILIVDDEPDIRGLISDILNDEGYQTRLAPDGDVALKEIELRQPSLIILDVWLGDPKYDGLKLLEMVKKNNPETPIIMISGHGTVETAVKAIKLGAYDFIEKPFKTDRLLLIVSRALEASQLKRENLLLKKKFHEESRIIGSSPAIQNLKKTIERVAPTNSRILISGAAGVGKELVAREIHVSSKRADAPFLVLNCQGLSSTQIEEHLFGCEADTKNPRRVGLLEQAHGGTIYLDEVTALSLETQAKLIRTLHEQAFKRIGGTQKVEIDVRVLASTKKDIKQEIEAGSFREDLYYRLSVVPLVLPSLKERQEDIPELVAHFAQIVANAAGVAKRNFSDSAIALFKAYSWPGNIHELKNVVERILIMTVAANDQVVGIDELPPEVRGEEMSSLTRQGAPDFLSLPLREAREYFEREYLLAQVNKFSGNISRTAAFIGMERSALHRKLRQLQVERNKRVEAS